MYILSVLICFAQIFNSHANLPFAKCSVITQQLNASAQVFMADLIPAFDASNLTTFMASFETKVLEELTSLHTRIGLIEQHLNPVKFDKIQAHDNIKQRKLEIHKFNATIHVEKNGLSVFTYYWKLPGIAEILETRKTKSVRSQSFYIFPKGYRLYLKFLPKFNSEFFNIQLGVTKGDYDDTLKWPFNLKYRISVLDQDPIDEVEDMVSKIWNPENICRKSFWLKPDLDNHGCVGISFTEEMLMVRNYIEDNSVIVKITVYLK